MWTHRTSKAFWNTPEVKHPYPIRQTISQGVATDKVTDKVTNTVTDKVKDGVTDQVTPLAPHLPIPGSSGVVASQHN